MPYVNIKILKASTSREQKSALIRAVSSALNEVLGKDPKSTVVVIDEIDADNWGSGGESVSDRALKGS